MKKMAIVLVAATMLCGCMGKQDKTEGVRSDSDSLKAVAEMEAMQASEKDSLEARLKHIYALDYSERTFEKFCSADFNEALQYAMEKCEDECGPLVFDPWLMAQDIQDPKMEITEVTLNGLDRATVVIDVTDFGNTNTEVLEMVKENGQWMVDDFIQVFDGDSIILKQDFRAY